MSEKFDSVKSVEQLEFEKQYASKSEESLKGMLEIVALAIEEETESFEKRMQELKTQRQSWLGRRESQKKAIEDLLAQK